MGWFFRIIGACTLCFFCNTAFAQAIATQFVYPVGDMYTPPTESGSGNVYKIVQQFNPSRTYVNGGANDAWCGDSSLLPHPEITNESACLSHTGYKWMYGHTGVDLSYGGQCSGTIRAIANGIVEFSGGYPGYGYLLKIKHILPNGRVIHSLYGHRQSAMMSVGQTVTMGQTVGYVRNTVGIDGSTGGGCHLHFAIYADEMQSIIGSGNTPVGYVFGDDGTYKTSSGTPIPANLMRYFYDPLLFVNDRNNRYSTGLACCTVMAPIFPSFQATTKTSYVTDGSGTTLSMQRAVSAGWLDPYLYEKHADGLWYYYPSKTNLDAYILQSGGTYGLIAKKTGLTFYYFKPGNTYLDARSRQDMVAYVQTVSGFGKAYRESFGINPNWSPPYAISWMSFVWNGTQQTWVNQAYDVNNPLNRYASYYNLSTGQWTSWVQVY